jgi:hypothetical protein
VMCPALLETPSAFPAYLSMHHPLSVLPAFT